MHMSLFLLVAEQEDEAFQTLAGSSDLLLFLTILENGATNFLFFTEQFIFI